LRIKVNKQKKLSTTVEVGPQRRSNKANVKKLLSILDSGFAPKSFKKTVSQSKSKNEIESKLGIKSVGRWRKETANEIVFCILIVLMVIFPVLALWRNPYGTSQEKFTDSIPALIVLPIILYIFYKF
jgi:hypothetical protein